MISPLVKWNHSITYNVPRFSETITRRFSVNLEDKKDIKACGIVNSALFLPPKPAESSNALSLLEDAEDMGTKLQKLVAYSLNIEDIEDIEKRLTLVDLGVDSMLLAEVIHNMQEYFNISVTPKQLRAMTFAQLKDLANEHEIARIG